MAAVGRFRDTNDISFIQPFEGKTIKDINGTAYHLETDRNALYEVAATGIPSFEDVYKLTV